MVGLFGVGKMEVLKVFLEEIGVDNVFRFDFDELRE